MVNRLGVKSPVLGLSKATLAQERLAARPGVARRAAKADKSAAIGIRQRTIPLTMKRGDLPDLPAYVNNDQALAAIVAAPTLEVRSLVCFLWATGARVSEALEVTPADLDPQRGTARVRSLKRKGGRVEHRICIVAGNYMATVLQWIVASTTRPHDPIWRHHRQWAWKQIGACLRKAGVASPTPHALRHGHAVHAVLSGVPLHLLSRQLGHTSIVTTGMYLRATAQDVSEAYHGVRW